MYTNDSAAIFTVEPTKGNLVGALNNCVVPGTRNVIGELLQYHCYNSSVPVEEFVDKILSTHSSLSSSVDFAVENFYSSAEHNFNWFVEGDTVANRGMVTYTLVVQKHLVSMYSNYISSGAGTVSVLNNFNKAVSDNKLDRFDLDVWQTVLEMVYGGIEEAALYWVESLKKDLDPAPIDILAGLVMEGIGSPIDSTEKYYIGFITGQGAEEGKSFHVKVEGGYSAGKPQISFYLMTEMGWIFVSTAQFWDKGSISVGANVPETFVSHFQPPLQPKKVELAGKEKSGAIVPEPRNFPAVQDQFGNRWWKTVPGYWKTRAYGGQKKSWPGLVSFVGFPMYDCVNPREVEESPKGIKTLYDIVSGPDTTLSMVVEGIFDSRAVEFVPLAHVATKSQDIARSATMLTVRYSLLGHDPSWGYLVPVDLVNYVASVNLVPIWRVDTKLWEEIPAYVGEMG